MTRSVVEPLHRTRSCYSCREFELCFVRHRAWELTLALPKFVNIDAENEAAKVPGSRSDIMCVIANACAKCEEAGNG